MPTPYTISGALIAILSTSIPTLPVYRNEAPQLETPTPVAIIYDGLSVITRPDLSDRVILEETVQVDLYTTTGSDLRLADALHVALHRQSLTVASGTVLQCLVVERQTNPVTGEPDGEQITRVTYTLNVIRTSNA